MNDSFLNKFSACFGKKESLMLKLAGLTEGEQNGRGNWVYTSDGEKWLDFGSFGIHLLGHCHPEIVETAARQLKKMGLSTKILGNYEATRCAQLLLSTLPGKMKRVVFANSGAESVEIAIKTAMLFKGKDEFIALKYSYHGKTTGAHRLSYHSGTSMKYRFPGFNVHFVDPIAPASKESFKEIFQNHPIAGVILEPVQGEGGINPIPLELIKELRDLCDRYDSLLILDEIQTGLGRCGKVWQAVSEDLCPDILLIGKTLGGGFVPISAAVFSERIDDVHCNDPLLNASSFAGGSLACAVAGKVIQIVTQDNFLATVRQKGEFCKNYLTAHLAGLPGIVDIRGVGLMLGIEFSPHSLTAHTVTEAAKKRLLLSFCLGRPQVLRIYPTAVIPHEELEAGLEKLTSVIKNVIHENFPG